MKLAIGSLHFYHADDWGGRLIQFRTHGPFSHVCIEIKGECLIEAVWPRVRLSDEFGTPAKSYTPDLPDAHKVESALDWLYEQVGNPYSLLDIAANIVTLINPNTPFLYTPILMDCSALATTFLLKAGYIFPADFKTDTRSIALVSPNDLARAAGLLPPV